MNGHDTIAMAILSHKAIDVDQKGHYGSTLLSIAVRNCLTQIVKVLLATGQVNFDTQDCFGGTLW
jgi:ankyrin repeat protein